VPHDGVDELTPARRREVVIDDLRHYCESTKKRLRAIEDEASVFLRDAREALDAVANPADLVKALDVEWPAPGGTGPEVFK
jgi:hypothetical protein